MVQILGSTAVFLARDMPNVKGEMFQNLESKILTNWKHLNSAYFTTNLGAISPVS